jgi:hypothetical protein
MSLWDKAKQLFGQSPQSGTLHAVSDQEHLDAIIKERPDLCDQLTNEPQEQTVTRDNGRDIIFLGWQVCNVEERHIKDGRRLAYLKLFQTRANKYVCQRMTLIDNEEKSYQATTVEDLDGVKRFFGEGSLALALYIMLDRQFPVTKKSA